MHETIDIEPVLANYEQSPGTRKIEFLSGAGGLSGALFWRITTLAGVHCLRRWPQEYPSCERLDLIHRVLAHVALGGVSVIPVPLETLGGRTFVERENHLWELTPWMPGRADYHDGREPAKLEAALSTLAQFHRAAASFPQHAESMASSPGLKERLAEVDRLAAGEFDELRRALASGVQWPQFERQALRIVERFHDVAPRVRVMLEDRSRLEVPLQPCIRDIRHDHVLFEDAKVTGLIDFGAMGVESVAADVARLLGSMVADDAAAWQQGLAAYERCRPLSPAESSLVEAFDRSGVLIAGFNWIRWICHDRRRFEQPQVVVARVAEIADRLAAL